MKISVKVKVRAKKSCVERVGETEYKVWVQKAPEKGKANGAVIEALSVYFKMAKSRISLVSGQTSTKKIFLVGG